MEKIQEIKRQVVEYVNEKPYIIYIICIIIGILFGWLLFGRTNIHNNGDTITGVGEQLDSIREYQSDAIRDIEYVRDGIEQDIERINRTEERTDNITESAIRIQEQNGNIYDAIRESTERIRQSRQIIKDIREGQKQSS